VATVSHSAPTAARAARSTSGGPDGAFKEIVAKLEQQRDAIDRALGALRDVHSMGAGPGSSADPAETSTPAKRKSRMTPEGKKRLIAALKKRWAERKKAGA